MKTPDTVAAVPPQYVNRFELWSNEGQTYLAGDWVPDVGMSSTYAVQYVATKGSRTAFLWVQDNKITNVVAFQPINDRAVFDPRGGYLGRGGQKLDPIQIEAPEPVDVLTAIKKMNQHVPPETDVSTINEMLEELSAEVTPDPAPLVHQFHLRPDFKVEILLPMDITEREAERLATFILSCPFWSEK